MTQEKKKYLTKTVSFGGSKMTLYSVDGNTWSSRLDELDLLQERFENGGRLPADATKGKQPFVIRKNKFAKRAVEDEPPSLDDYDDAAVAIEDESLAGVVLDEEIEEESLVDEVPAIKALSKAAKKGVVVGVASLKDRDDKTGPNPLSINASRPLAEKSSAKSASTKTASNKLDTKLAKGAATSDKGAGKSKAIAKALSKTSEKGAKTGAKSSSGKSLNTTAKSKGKGQPPSTGGKIKESAKGNGSKDKTGKKR